MKINPPPFPGVEYFSGFNYYSKAVIEINYWVWRRNMGAYGGNGSYLIIQLGDKTSLSSHRTPHHLSFSGKTHTHTHTHTHTRGLCVSGKESTCNARDAGLIPGSGRSPGGEMAIHFSILAGKYHGQRSLAGCSPWGRKRIGRDWATEQ